MTQARPGPRGRQRSLGPQPSLPGLSILQYQIHVHTWALQGAHTLVAWWRPLGTRDQDCTLLCVCTPKDLGAAKLALTRTLINEDPGSRHSAAHPRTKCRWDPQMGQPQHTGRNRHGREWLATDRKQRGDAAARPRTVPNGSKLERTVPWNMTGS